MKEYKQNIIKIDSREYLRDDIKMTEAAVCSSYGKTSGSLRSQCEIKSAISKELNAVVPEGASRKGSKELIHRHTETEEAFRLRDEESLNKKG